MKLLEIFFVWGNQDEFRATAQELRDTMGAQVEWDKIVIMGKQICPDDELFAGDAGIGSGADIDLEFDSGERQVADADAPATDLDLAFGEDAESVDLGFGEEPSVPSGDDATGVQLTPDAEAPFASPRPGSEDVTVESTALASDEGDDALDFDLGLEFAAAEPEPEPEPEPDSGEVLREQIRSKLSSTDTDETAEMDLADLGVDLDLGTGPSPALDQGAAASFDDVFEQETDATSEMPAPTAELTAGAPGLDLDIGTLFDGTAGDDDTSRDLQSLDDAMADTADSGHFSAEIETLHGDALDVDISSFGDASHDETKLIASDEPTGAPVEEAFSVSVFGDAAEAGGAAASADETRLIGPDDTVLSADDDFSASVFGQSDDETVLTEGLGQGDGLATDMFNFDGDDGEGGAVDLDLGDAMDDDADGDRTTVKVATADLALPDGGDELGEVGTKLDLARAYMDMGDPDGARGILEEVLSEGNESQQADARQMLESLS